MVVVSSFKQTCRYLQVNLMETMGCKQDKQTRPPKYVCCVYHLWGKYLSLCKQVIVGCAVMQLSCKNVWHDSDTILFFFWGGGVSTRFAHMRYMCMAIFYTDSWCMLICYFDCMTTYPDSKVHGPTWGPSGTDRTQVGPMLASWTLLSG